MSSDIGYDEAACVAAFRAECDEGVALAKQRGWTFHPDAVDACVASQISDLDKCDLSELAGSFVPRNLACRRIFTGSVEEGGACEQRMDCKAPSDANAYAYCRDGKCGIGYIDFGEGESCGADRYCVDGLDCDWSSASCQRLTKAGESCTISLFCEEGFFCDDSDTCVPKKGIGEPCTDSYECKDVLYCDYHSHTCVPDKAIGEECEDISQCPGWNCTTGGGSDGAKCEEYLAVNEGFCKGVVEDEE